MDFGWQQAEDSVCREEYQDNWMRTFRGVPEFTPNETDMLKDWINEGHYIKAAIYLTEDQFNHSLDGDYAEFVIREILRGNL